MVRILLGGPRQPIRHRRLLFAGSLLVALLSLSAVAAASRRVAAGSAAFSAPRAGRCVPSTLNRSAVLGATTLAATPLPGSYDALPRTQVSLLGAPSATITGVSATGSASGRHAGRLRAFSQGDGVSFVPNTPFISGETVTVAGRQALAGRSQAFAYQFVVAREDALPYVRSPHPSRDPLEKLHFRSRPDLEPPLPVISSTSAQSSPGYIFAAPYSGPGPAGPMIFDEAGNLVWFQPMSGETQAANLQVQTLDGEPVLTWWQGYIPPQGFGRGEEVILSTAYRQIARVHAGNGYTADLHDFHMTAQGTAILTVFEPIACDLSQVGGPRSGAVTDSLFQEVDLRTGLVRREWHSVDHIPLSDSYSAAATSSAEWPFDYAHINSIEQLAGGSTLISARNTWALYELSTATGQVTLQIGGKHSSLKLPSAAQTAYQHDASVLANGQISVFDNGGVPMVHPQSRALIESIDPSSATGQLVAQFVHPSPLRSGSQGNVQPLPNGDLFIGWGSAPYFSEFSPSGQLLFDAHFHGSYQSYRGYRFPWSGAPTAAPSAIATGPAGRRTVYVSWNGDTRTASWRLLAGATAKALAPSTSAARTGFETALAAPAGAAYLAVQALDASGAVIGTSPAIHG
jgi:Arylsulfotransferase (ASST)